MWEGEDGRALEKRKIGVTNFDFSSGIIRRMTMLCAGSSYRQFAAQMAEDRSKICEKLGTHCLRNVVVS